MSIEVTSANDSNEAKLAPQTNSAVKQSESEETETTSDETLDASDASSDDQEEETQTEEAEADSEQSDKAPAKKSGFKRRVEKLNARISQKDQELEYWKSEALKKTTEKKDEPKAAATQEEASGKPKSEDYETYEGYAEALAEWTYERKVTENSRKAKEEEAKQSFQTKQQDYAKSVQSFKETHDDFDEVLESIDDILVPMVIQEMIVSSKNGPELAYELAKHRDELARISKLGDFAAAREFGKFEARILKSQESVETTKKPEAKKLTQAPPPLKTVGSGTSLSKKDPNDMEYDEFKAWRASQKG